MGKLIEAVRKLGTKMTGKKTVESNSLVKVINDIADDYEGGGGGTTVVANPILEGTEPDLTGLQVGDTKYKVPEGGSGGNDSFFSLAEFTNYVRGKVLDVDKTVELFDEAMEEVGYSVYYDIMIPPITNEGGGEDLPILGFINNSGYYLSICGFTFDIDTTTREDLIAAKETIESTPIYSTMQYPFVVQAIFLDIHTVDSYKQKIISYERLKSLFKEYTPTNE